MKIKLGFLVLTSFMLLITCANAEVSKPTVNVKKQRKKVAALRCDSRITLGFGDTTKPSDTRFAAQWCRATGRTIRDSFDLRNFVPGSGDRIFNNSLTPCTQVTKARLFCGKRYITKATIRPGCPNNRSTFDFCAPNGGGARAIDELCKGRKMTIEVTTAGRKTFCYNPPGANITFRNGQEEPNRTS